jgi:chemotaxis protein methyltransferase CheR
MAIDADSINAGEYSEFCELLRSYCGIVLGANKQYLVATRIRRIMLEHKLNCLNDLNQLLKKQDQRQLRQSVIDAMTTNETFWFRDIYPFEYLVKELLPKKPQNKYGDKIRIWSAACSSGQEPYSISIVIDEAMRSGQLNRSTEVEIVATDLSSSVLAAAMEGQYDKISLNRGMSEARLEEYFNPLNSDVWCLKNSIKNRVKFRPINLQEPFVMMGKYDVIYCRNVLIYFAPEAKQEILRKLHSCLVPGGVLFLGSSESLSGQNELYEMINCNPGVAYRAKNLNLL